MGDDIQQEGHGRRTQRQRVEGKRGQKRGTDVENFFFFFSENNVQGESKTQDTFLSETKRGNEIIRSYKQKPFSVQHQGPAFPAVLYTK